MKNLYQKIKAKHSHDQQNYEPSSMKHEVKNGSSEALNGATSNPAYLLLKRVMMIIIMILTSFFHNLLIAQPGNPIYKNNTDSVVQAWVQRYSGPGNLHDNATAIAVDNQGNVYITGWSSETPVFPNEYDYDYATIKYNPDGVVQWVQRYDGLGALGDDRATAIAVDDQGNVYVTGRSQGTYLDYEYATIKYNTGGVQQWVQRFGGSYHNRATAIAVDNQGNVYVTGRSWGMGSEDYATIKYNMHGEPQWVRRYNGPANGDDYAWAIAVDNAGNVYVTGQSAGSGTAWDYATVKYDTDGMEQWAVRYDGPGSEFDVARAIGVDNNGNVYVTGYSVGLGTGRDFATIKYNTTGELQWVARYNGPANQTDEANDLVVDNDGNVYVTGYSGYGLGTFYDFATIKYNTNGDELWASRYSGPEDWDVARAIALDNFGNVYVTGYSYGTGTQQDYLTVAYNNNGAELWTKRYNGPGNLNDVAHAIAVDHSGNVFITGRSVGEGNPLFYDDYATIKYEQTFSIIPGDANCDGVVNVLDVIATSSYVLGQNPQPFCPENADVNGDGFINLVDIIATIEIIMGGGSVFECGVSSVTDIDGNSYPTVLIGNQCWMAENLRATNYQDGTTIPTGLNDGQWANADYGAFTIYPHANIPGLNSDEEVMLAYGILYNWYAVADSRNICPEGWYVPSHPEWTQLENYMMTTYSLINHPDAVSNGLGNALKSCRQVNSPSGGDCTTSEHPRWNAHGTHYGSDMAGFEALPAGRRRLNGVFFDIGNYGMFWTSTSHTQTHAVNRTIFSDQGSIAGFFSTNYRKTIGYSVRCIKE